ncbi:INO80 complex subunit C [Condylostylus longicornis]|uniref:INO80 complex subunit C n=1 Tax=Condylostylus longicornis TaxID=2530218 RepID=UPI00244E4380|nr:INO80 complex subunit C [Condylostylus longicornis]
MSTSTTQGVATENAMPKFKKKSFINYHSKNKKSQWKSLKQIVTYERSLPWSEDAVIYSSLNPPPSFYPAKKYSDISGLIGLYTDPETKIRYHNSEEYITVKNLPMDLRAGYLQLRGATNIVG